MPERVTLQTIADALGISRTTVSNAYNRPDQLAAELRARILETARSLGYAGPDPAARRLRSGRRDAVGLLFTENLSFAFTDPAAIMLLQGIARATDRAQLPLLLFPSPQDASGTSAVRDAVVSAFCIYSMPDGHPGVQAAFDRRLPIVVVDEPRLDGHAYVGIDDRRGARMAAEHLLALGHRRFAVLSDRTSESLYTGPMTAEREANAAYRVARDRLGGYREALTAAGVAWEDVPKWECAMNLVEEGRAGARALLDRAPDLTALLVATDQLAIGALEHLHAAGIAVPDRVSLVGFDDVPAAALVQPPLTTVRQPLEEKGLAAGRMLVEGAGPAELLLEVELAVRGSTGPPG